MLTSISSSMSLNSNNDNTPTESKKSIDSYTLKSKTTTRKVFRQSIQTGDASIKGLSLSEISGKVIITNFNQDGKIQVWDVAVSLKVPIKQYLHGELKEKKRLSNKNIGSIDQNEKKKQDGNLICMATATHKLIAENNSYDDTLTIVSGSKDGYLRIYHLNVNNHASDTSPTSSEAWEGPYIVHELIGIKLKAIRSITIKEVDHVLWIVSGCEDGHIAVWDICGVLLWDFDPLMHDQKSAAVTSLYIHIPNSSDERTTIVSGNKDDLICKWGTSEHDSLLQSKHHCHKNQSGITSVIVYEPNNVDQHFETIIITAGSNNCIIIWSYLNLEKLRILEGHSDTITGLCLQCTSDPFHPVIMSSSRDRTVRFWSFSSGRCFREMKMHVKSEQGSKPEPVNCIAVTSINQDFLVVSGGDDCNIRLTDFNGDELIYTFKSATVSNKKTVRPSLCLTSTDFLNGVDSKRKSFTDIKSEFSCPFILEADTEKSVVKITSCFDNEVQTRIELEGLDNGMAEAQLTFFHMKSVSSRFPSNIIALIRPISQTIYFDYHGRYENTRKQSIADMILMNNNEDDTVDNDFDESASERHRSESTAARHRSESYTRTRVDSADENAYKNPNNYCYLWPVIPSLKCPRIELRGHTDVVTCITFCESDILIGSKKKTIVSAVTGSADGTLRRWDISTGKFLGLVEAHREGVTVLKSFKQIPKSNNDNDNDKNNDTYDDKNEAGLNNNNTKASNPEHFQSYIVSGGRDFFVKIYAANTLDNDYAPVIEEFEHYGEVHDIAIYNVAGQDIQIITTAADKIIRIISFNSLEIKQQIKSNCIGSITSLAIHSFHLGNRGNKNWIAIGTSDGITQIWDMKSETLLRELKSNSNKEISEVAIVTLPYRQFANMMYRREPILVTLNSDGVINLFESFFACKDANAYPVLTPALVRREYRWDQHKSNAAVADSMSKESEKDDEAVEYEDKVQINKQKKLSWPRISNLVERCEASRVFDENAGLFWTAIDEGRSDFLNFFLGDVPWVVTAVYQDDDKLCRSLLGKALHKKDLQSVRVVLGCWKTVMALSSKDSSSLFNHYFFVSDHLHKDCLVELSKRYPNEFHDFIVDLKTIPSHPCVGLNCDQAMLAPGKCLVAGVNDSAEAKELWVRHLDEHYRINQVKAIKKRYLNAQIVATFLPINHAATNDILTCLVKTSASLNTVSLFETDIGRFAVQFAWESYGRKLHIRSMVEYCIYLAVFSSSCFLFNRLVTSDNQQYSNLAWAIQGVVISGVLYFFMLELYQAKGHWIQHMLDVWNFIDIISYVTVFTGTILRIIYLSETSASRIVLSIASLLTWLKLLYFLRGFEGTGHFVAMVFVIAYEIRFFLLVLIIVIFGFSQSFWLIGGDSLYGNLSTTTTLLVEAMLGTFYSVDFSETISEEYSTVLFIFYCIVIILLLLNLLIAQMNSTYAKVAQKGFAAQFKFERAKIIIEESFLLSKFQESDPKLFPRSIHVLRRFADVEQEKFEDEKESDLAYIKKIVEGMKDKVNDLENRTSTAEERTIKQMSAFEKHSELMKVYLEKVEEKDVKILEYFDKNDPILQRTSVLQEAHEKLLQSLQDQLLKRGGGEQSCNPIMMMKFPFNEGENT